MWKGSGRSLLTNFIAENCRLALFIATPIFIAGIFCNDTMVERIVRSRQYVTYPAEGERPPMTEEEVRDWRAQKGRGAAR